MQTLNEIYSAFKLSKSDINRLRNEAKAASIDCGKKGVDKRLATDTWDLFYDISDKVWYSNKVTISEKIFLGFQLYDTFPDYYHFLTPFYHSLNNGEIFNSEDKEIIWKQFLKYLGSEKYYADPVGYVLWVDFFEDQTTVEETWQGLISNCRDKNTLLRLLTHSEPVSYNLKEIQCKNLIDGSQNHTAIFDSLLYSGYDYFGKIDKKKANNGLKKIKVDKTSENYKLLKAKL